MVGSLCCGDRLPSRAGQDRDGRGEGGRHSHEGATWTVLQLSRATGCFILSKSRVWVWVRVVSAGWWVLGAVPVWGMQAQVGFYMAGGEESGQGSEAGRGGGSGGVWGAGGEMGKCGNTAPKPSAAPPPEPEPERAWHPQCRPQGGPVDPAF